MNLSYFSSIRVSIHVLIAQAACDTLVRMKKGSQSKMYSQRLEIALIDALQKIKERDGIPVSEQVKRAIRAWLEKKGVKA
jgi:hypothetical protein